MLDGLDPGTILDLARLAGGGGIFIYFFLMLVKRGDTLQRENIADLRKNRDDWQRRAENAERQLAHLMQETHKHFHVYPDEDGGTS